MEHSSHAHPLPNGRNVLSDEPTVLSYASCSITCSPTVASLQQNECPSQQTRRLQLRNTGFRGPALPFRRISPLLGASPSGIEAYTRPMSNDDSPSSAEKRTLYGENLPQSPVNILQEIHRLSTRKKRNSPMPGVATIFEDNNEKGGVGGTSWYNGGSNEGSPATPITPAKMNQLREISVNQRTPPSTDSPSIKYVKNRRSARVMLRSASCETTAQYIEHLESELASAHAKLDLQPSPKTSKLRSAKLRNLITENRNLKHEISEWQRNLDDKIQEERSKRLDADMELRSGMRTLEDEVEMKNARMAELEWEIESMRVRLRDLEGLEAINIGLEKRIEALTNLLVESPTKPEVTSASISPYKRDPTKRTPRPRSMLPRVPGSPDGLQSSLATVSELTNGRSQSLGYFSNAVESPVEDSKDKHIVEDFQSPSRDEDMASPSAYRQSGSFGGRSRASISFRSTPSSASRPTSLRSSCSFGPVAWGLTEQENRSATKQRKMRRFPSGSNSLKPLILPTSNVASSLPASATTFPSLDGTMGQDTSSSLGPTTAFLSSPENSPTMSTPEHLVGQRSPVWAQEQTLKALEGKFRNIIDGDGSDMQSSHSPCLETEANPRAFRGIRTEKQKRWSRPRSLQKELEEAEVELDSAEQAGIVQGKIREDEATAIEGQKESGRLVTDFNPSHFEPPLLATSSQQRCQAPESDPTPRPHQLKPPTTRASPKSVKALPSTSFTNEHACGLFSRLTQIITKTKQDPCCLARRLLLNAWSLGSKRLGGMAWWLLGLVYGTRWRMQDWGADSGIVEDSSTLDFDWHQFSTEANSSQPRERCFRKRGILNSDTESRRSPPQPSRRATQPIDNSSRIRRHSHLFPCDKCVEPSSRRTIRLWLQFSLAIVLAVGMAVKHGPGTMLCADDRDGERPDHPQSYDTEALPADPSCNVPSQSCTRDEGSEPSGNSDDTNGVDSGYGTNTFAETLVPADFEDP